jgi:hypothetical protein
MYTRSPLCKGMNAFTPSPYEELHFLRRLVLIARHERHRVHAHHFNLKVSHKHTNLHPTQLDLLRSY